MRIFTPEDYPFAAGSGATKLAESAIAPLVAHARGTRSLTPGEVRGFLDENDIRSNSSRGKQIRRSVGGTDAMVMPWYHPSQIDKMQKTRTLAPAYTTQLRPNPVNLVPDPDTGKVAKYVNLAGEILIISQHPSTPADWITHNGRRMLFTEGQLKADSAVTAQLLHHGVDPEELRVREGEDQLAARERLTELHQRIPEDDQVVIIAFFSVTTFSRNNEWNAIRLGDRRHRVPAYVAFDGDVATNPDVYRGAKKAFDIISKNDGEPHLIDLSIIDTDGKVGMDDFLAEHGGWTDLLTLATPALPASPEPEPIKGEWSMDAPSCTTREWVPGNEETGTDGHWREVLPYIARLAVVEDHRSVSDTETATGEYSVQGDARQQRSVVEIEVSWVDEKGTTRSDTIYGPHTLLMVKPDRWSQTPGTAIPSSVARLPNWPATSEKFLAAMKSHRADETVVRALWSHMGWVPTPEGTPVFVVGDQVVGPDGLAPHCAASGVNDTEISNASKFGVVIPDTDQEAYDALVRVLDTYRPADPGDAVWQDPKNAAVFLSTALRPCIPLRSSTPLVLAGASSAGKSFSAAAIICFWQNEPGAWSEKSLPGSASDTAASAEVAMSKTPIWVVDDLAPDGNNHAAAERSAAAVWRLARDSFNGSSRARRNADMTAQTINKPRAQLIITAEQGPDNRESIANRVVLVRVRAGQFLAASRKPTNKLTKMSRETTDQAIVTGYILRGLARQARDIGWSQLVSDLAETRNAYKQIATEHSTQRGGTDRFADVAADIGMGLTALTQMVGDLEDAAVDVDPGIIERLAQMRLDLEDVASSADRTARDVQLGRQFIADLRYTLASRAAHVSALGMSGPPISHGADGPIGQAHHELNDLLGWHPASGDNDPRPGGDRVGIITTLKDSHEPAVLFHTRPSLAAVQRYTGNYRSSNARHVWEDVVRVGLHDTGRTIRDDRWEQRVSMQSSMQTGIVIPLWRLLDRDGPYLTP